MEEAKKRLSKRKIRRMQLDAEGKDFFNFVFPIIPFKLWAETVESKGIKPNDRLWQFIVDDMKNGDI